VKKIKIIIIKRCLMIKINSIYKKIESDAATRLRFSLGCFRIPPMGALYSVRT
jgi:hypothetical protein